MLTTFLFGSAFVLLQTEKNNSLYNHSTTQVENSAENSLDCSQCQHNEMCVDGKCINLDLLERQAMIQFDNACRTTRCNEGEACVAGLCFQPSSFRDLRAGPSCLNTDCDEGQTCYRGVCYKAIDENGNPVECTAGEATELYAPPTCSEGNVCSDGRCINSRIPESQLPVASGIDMLPCKSGMIRLSGTCVSLIEKSCRNCKTGEVCLGGACYGLTEKMGEPCKNNRCSSGSRCLSGICIKQ
jgi:hypothetical protein